MCIIGPENTRDFTLQRSCVNVNKGSTYYFYLSEAWCCLWQGRKEELGFWDLIIQYQRNVGNRVRNLYAVIFYQAVIKLYILKQYQNNRCMKWNLKCNKKTYFYMTQESWYRLDPYWFELPWYFADIQVALQASQRYCSCDQGCQQQLHTEAEQLLPFGLVVGAGSVNVRNTYFSWNCGMHCQVNYTSVKWC